METQNNELKKPIILHIYSHSTAWNIKERRVRALKLLFNIFSTLYAKISHLSDIKQTFPIPKQNQPVSSATFHLFCLCQQDGQRLKGHRYVNSCWVHLLDWRGLFSIKQIHNVQTPVVVFEPGIIRWAWLHCAMWQIPLVKVEIIAKKVLGGNWVSFRIFHSLTAAVEFTPVNSLSNMAESLHDFS